MANGTPNNFLTGMKVLFGVLTTTMAALSQTLLRNDLIPEQISFVGSIGALFIVVALLVTLGYYERLRKRMWVWLAIAFVTLVIVAALQVRYVVALNLGDPPEAQKYLVGYKLTDEGNRQRERLGRNKSETEFVADSGVDRITEYYGSSYYVLAFIYSGSYILFVISVVLALGSVVIPKQVGPPPPPPPPEEELVES